MQDFLSEYQIELSEGGKKIEVAEVGFLKCISRLCNDYDMVA